MDDKAIKKITNDEVAKDTLLVGAGVAAGYAAKKVKDRLHIRDANYDVKFNLKGSRRYKEVQKRKLAKRVESLPDYEIEHRANKLKKVRESLKKYRSTIPC